MATIYKVDCPNRKPLFEGVQGENEARSIQFDITAWVEELGAGAVTATAKRPTDAQPYPVTIEQGDGNIVTWKPTSTDTAFEGVGSFQLEYTVDDVLAKTCIWSTQIAPSLDPAGDPPDPYDNWLASMREVAAAAQQSANDSAASAQQAAGEVTNAQTEVKNAEAWAVGTKGGVDVPSTDESYHNNAKYWAGQAENLKDGTQTIVDEARADVFEAMDGMHEETTAGSALQLISDKYTEDKVPYLFRMSGGGKSIGNREFDTLVGGSVAFNQLEGFNRAQETLYGVTGRNDNGVTTLNGTATQNSAFLPSNTGTSVEAIVGHKYLAFSNISNPSTNRLCVGVYIAAMLKLMNGTNGVIYNHTSGTGKIQIGYRYVSGAQFSNENIKGGLIDLTQMFGTSVADRLYAMEQANAGSGVALFRSWFPKDYYAYNTGELMSVKTSAHEMTGLNQWDEEWELGGIQLSDGANFANAARLRSKNYIPALPSTNYYFCAQASLAYTSWLIICFYDENKNFISGISPYANNVFVTPSNARYIRFSTSDAWSGKAYNGGFCISISSDRNGEYQPYTKHTYALDDVELRGVPKLDGTDIYFDGDAYEADGTVTRRFGIVDLGTLNWTYQANYPRFYSTGINTLAKGNNDGANAICSKYKVGSVPTEETTSGVIAISGSGLVLIKDTAYTDPTAFKTAMSGVYLIYELAIPATETADPFTSPQIVDAYGTERYVDERTVAVPVGHITKYPDNLRDKLDGLPWDFSSLIAPTEKAYTATRNYTAGSLLIVNNILYKVTANIANGGAITPNTNVTATTLAEIISAL